MLAKDDVDAFRTSPRGPSGPLSDLNVGERTGDARTRAAVNPGWRGNGLPYQASEAGIAPGGFPLEAGADVVLAARSAPFTPGLHQDRLQRRPRHQRGLCTYSGCTGSWGWRWRCNVLTAEEAHMVRLVPPDRRRYDRDRRSNHHPALRPGHRPCRPQPGNCWGRWRTRARIESALRAESPLHPGAGQRAERRRGATKRSCRSAPPASARRVSYQPGDRAAFDPAPLQASHVLACLSNLRVCDPAQRRWSVAVWRWRLLCKKAQKRRVHLVWVSPGDVVRAARHGDDLEVLDQAG
jgi:hypothetical protein